MNNTFYFAQDGSYGVWDSGSMLTDTTAWTALDWEEIENCSNNERTFIVRGIVDKYIKRMGGVL